MVREAAALDGSDRPRTVADAIAGYLAELGARRARRRASSESVAKLRILPELGDIPIEAA